MKTVENTDILSGFLAVCAVCAMRGRLAGLILRRLRHVRVIWKSKPDLPSIFPTATVVCLRSSARAWRKRRNYFTEAVV
jgi:hypothetical protein